MFQQEVYFKDYFSILEVSPFACSAVVQSAYRALARVYHPDLQGVMPENSKTMADINEAYNILSDPIKREGYWEIFLQEHIKKEQIRGKHFYFYKNWEESLKKREQELLDLKIKKKQKTEVKTGIQEYIEKFLNASGSQIYSILREVKKAPEEVQEEFLQSLILSSYLTLEMEKELLKWVLEDNKPNYVPFISKAFKYKDLYPELFSYIHIHNITDYWDKILLIAKHLNIQTEANLFLAIQILQMDFPDKTKQELKEFAKQEWLGLSFWNKRKQTKEYKALYHKLELILK